ncbi:MAG TPA: hypothetical protein VJP45_04080 [Candidatus Limnocylindria bacterium]|nr:hypothetical protein [Candidatus Limnocylindria bacterium]
MSVRGTIAYAIAFAAFVAIALPLDRSTSAIEQSVLGLSAWVFLVIALRFHSPAVRVQVAVLVVLATLLEIVGSIVWGAYRYRLENLPLYVPAGHGLFYLAALRVASLPFLERHGRSVVLAVTAGATAWMLYGLARPPLPDLLGFVTWAIFIRFVVRGRYPLLYAVSFAMTTALELYGTGLGIWRWAPVLPGLMLPAGNPPTGIGAGYAAMDALTRRIIGRLRPRADARHASSTADGAALPTSSTRAPEAALAD